MRNWILVLCLLGGSATASGRDEPLDAAQVKPQIVALVAAIKQALDREDRDVLATHFDVPEMIAEVERAGVLELVPVEQRAGFRLALGIGLRAGLAQPNPLFAFASAEVRSVHVIAGTRRVRAYVRLRDEDEYTTRVQWSLVQRDGRWRIYDAEDLEVGLGVTAMLGLVVADATAGGASDWTSPLQALQRAQVLIAEDETDAAHDLLTRLAEEHGDEIPAHLRSVLEALEGSIELGWGWIDEALAHFDEADRLRPGMPLLDYLRAVAHNDATRHAEALQAARTYIRRLDADPEINVELGRALIGLSRPTEALAPLAAALAEVPGHTEAFAFYAMALPAGRDEELARAFARIRDVGTHFEESAEILLEEGAFAALARITALLRRVLPEHPDVAYYEGHGLLHESRHAQAAAAFATAIARVEQAGYERALRLPYYDAYLRAMVAAGKPLEGYAGCPDKAFAFRYVLDGHDDATQRDVLQRLLAASAQATGIEDLRTYLAGSLAVFEERPAEGAKALEGLYARLQARAEDEDDDGYDLRARTRNRLVPVLVGLERYAAALDIARAHDLEEENGFWFVYVYAHQGDVEKARAAILRAVEQGLDPDEVFESDYVREILAGEAYADLRKRLLEER